MENKKTFMEIDQELVRKVVDRLYRVARDFEKNELKKNISPIDALGIGVSFLDTVIYNLEKANPNIKYEMLLDIVIDTFLDKKRQWLVEDKQKGI